MIEPPVESSMSLTSALPPVPVPVKKPLFLPECDMVSNGCRVCVWRLHDLCPHNIQDGSVYSFTSSIGSTISGYCMDYIRHILSLADDTDSINVFWEKFSLYMAKLQMMDDYHAFMKLNKEVSNLDKSSLSDSDLMNYELKLNTLRLWWERLNMSVRSGYSKIAEREQKTKSSSSVAGILNAKTINFNLGSTSDKQVLIE